MRCADKKQASAQTLGSYSFEVNYHIHGIIKVLEPDPCGTFSVDNERRLRNTTEDKRCMEKQVLDEVDNFMIQKFKCLKNMTWYRCKRTLVILYVMRRAWSSYFQKLFKDHTVWHGLRRGLMCWCKY